MQQLKLTLPTVDEELEMDFGNSAFQRPDFIKSVKVQVRDDVNATLGTLGYKPVDPADFDIAHKVPIDVIKQVVMHYVRENGEIGWDDLVAKSDSLYSSDASRYPIMTSLRTELRTLVAKKKHTVDDATLEVIDKANDLIHELNSAPDNLGLGFPSENRSIGAQFDLVIRGGQLTPRSRSIYDAFNQHVDFAYSGARKPANVRSSQVTSQMNFGYLTKK
ncbi:hypothetical protein [Azospirillum sp. TSO22-1]|uniref:hypothetical protein n=1 Tax=Azospirillum sp. TSO22-1 TaxID=716789 RepID=UPI000D61A312|nr:hypothetical protein [Azospirillum sp. TSO22-1]PWC55790.1 hypothetical protein TSO221_03510 [Azospirillum sp. TSO22-1]